ncbi:MAG: nitroreductase family protein [Clostridia bacterium]|nr:nitroreductase family protein [Clostridia bacterium]
MTNLNELEELYLTRQSCRAFDRDKPVERELLERVCRLALLSPSACNAQPWKLYLVTGDKAKEAVKGLQDMGMNKFASDAPALVVITESKSNLTASVGARIKDNDFTHNDIGILTAHLVLAAEAAGLQSCILGWRNEKKICETLSLPKGTRIPEVVALGYAAQGYDIRPKKRKNEKETLVFIE